MINIEELINSIAEATAESIRNYDIYKSIEGIKNDTSRMISEIIGG